MKNLTVAFLLPLLAACAMNTVDENAGEATIERNLSYYKCEYDCEFVGSPVIYSGPERNSRYSFAYEAEFDVAPKWIFGYGSSKNLGDTVVVRFPNNEYRAKQQWASDGSLYNASIKREDIAEFLENAGVVKIAGESDVAEIKVTKAVARVFLQRADEIDRRWAESRTEIFENLVRKAQERTTTERDEYKRLTWLNGPSIPLAKENLTYNLYARLEDSGEKLFWLRIASDRPSGIGWAFYNYAIDGDGKKHHFKRDSDVGYAGRTFERLHIPVTIDYLQQAKAGGIDMKIYGDRATAEIHMESWLIAAFLRSLETHDN